MSFPSPHRNTKTSAGSWRSSLFVGLCGVTSSNPTKLPHSSGRKNYMVWFRSRSFLKNKKPVCLMDFLMCVSIYHQIKSSPDKMGIVVVMCGTAQSFPFSLIWHNGTTLEQICLKLLTEVKLDSPEDMNK